MRQRWDGREVDELERDVYDREGRRNAAGRSPVEPLGLTGGDMLGEDHRQLHGQAADLTGSHAFGAHLDEADGLIYFARPGVRIPKGRSAYNVSVVVGPGLVALWIGFLLVGGDFDGYGARPTAARTLALAVPSVLLIVFLLAAPFVRRFTGGEGRLHDAIRDGAVIGVRRTQPLAGDLASYAQRGWPGYFEQAEKLATADALRLQSEQMRELHQSGAVSGSGSASAVAELLVYADRLDAAAAEREDAVRDYFEAAHRG